MDEFDFNLVLHGFCLVPVLINHCILIDLLNCIKTCMHGQGINTHQHTYEVYYYCNLTKGYWMRNN